MDKDNINVNREVWLFLLKHLNLTCEEYFYMLGMLDVILPDDNSPRLTSPLVDYLYKIKVSMKGE